MAQQLSMEMLPPEKRDEIEKALVNYKPTELSTSEKTPEPPLIRDWPAPDFKELDPEIREQQVNFSLKYRWQSAGVLHEGDPVVILDHTGACEIGVFQNNAQGMPNKEVLELNNPIKTAAEWYTLRWKITGSNVVNNPERIDARLMTPKKFMDEVHGIPTSKQSQWLDVVNRLDQNLQMLEHAVKNPQ